VEVGELEPVDLDDVLVPLQAMAKALDWKAPRRRFKGDRNAREPNPEGRNCALFDLTRWWAYDEVERDGAAILKKALEINSTFANPLSYGEVASVARSITRFMFARYDGRGHHTPLSRPVIQQRQIAGRQTHAERQRTNRDNRLVDAAYRIQARGEAPVQQAVATEAGVSLRTVQSAWAEVWGRIVNTPQPLPPLSDSSAVEAAAEPHGAPSECSAAAPALPIEPPLTPSNIIRLASLPGSQAPQPIDWSPGGFKKRARLASKRRCTERLSWHEAAAGRGLRFYRDAVAARYAALFREQRAALNSADDRDIDESADPVLVAAMRERMAERKKFIQMGFAARRKAEDRLSRQWDDVLQEREGITHFRFRTTLDAVDRVAVALSSAFVGQSSAALPKPVMNRFA